MIIIFSFFFLWRWKKKNSPKNITEWVEWVPNRISITQAGAVTHVAPQSCFIAVPFLSLLLAVIFSIIHLSTYMNIYTRRPSPQFLSWSITISFVCTPSPRYLSWQRATKKIIYWDVTIGNYGIFISTSTNTEKLRSIQTTHSKIASNLVANKEKQTKPNTIDDCGCNDPIWSSTSVFVLDS